MRPFVRHQSRLLDVWRKMRYKILIRPLLEPIQGYEREREREREGGGEREREREHRG